jgi:hypothetical protein
MKHLCILIGLLPWSVALAGDPMEVADDLEAGPTAWSVEGEQHTTIEPAAEAYEGHQALRVNIRRAEKTWSNVQLKLRCPPTAMALLFRAKAVDQDLTIHPQFRASANWENWALWLDQPITLSTGVWSECEIRLDRCHNLFSKGEISKDILAEKEKIDAFLISANQDADEGAFIIDDLRWLKEP